MTQNSSNVIGFRPYFDILKTKAIEPLSSA
jgi:hypothetical protein